MTETELRIADLESRIGDIDLRLTMTNCGFATIPVHYRALLVTREHLMEELRCLKQSLPQRQSES